MIHFSERFRFHVTLNRSTLLPRQRVNVQINLFRTSFRRLAIGFLLPFIEGQFQSAFLEPSSGWIDAAIAQARSISRLPRVPLIKQFFDLVAFVDRQFVLFVHGRTRNGIPQYISQLISTVRISSLR
ncbi:hypothetical protein WL77_28980 [Burkholderia ubonensis]|nr:hypothetical protein WL77_28980 [Burkholderia ubonensis]